ncbi:MAG TPA: GDP-mannose 4,6-dehydratase [Blastocatellia bacterium]|nr:GDP-mannose 4,6-dehydratase [Blastocatellia bacterium]
MSIFTDRTVMVAGGAGFVGSAIVRELLDIGARVVCLDNYLHGTPSNLERLDSSLTVVQADAIELWKVIQTIKQHRVEYIIDCIGDTYVPSAYEMPKRFFDINLQATFNILMAAKVCDVERVLYVSSTEVYGQHRREKFTEETPINPLNTYAVSKVAADRLCFTFHVEHKVPVVIARIFNCYGPRETHPYIIPEIIRQLHRGPNLQLGNIKAERDLTFVHDTARALIAVLESSIPDGQAVNVGSDTSYSVEWLVHKIAELMGVADVNIRIDPQRLRHLDLECLRCDNAKLRRATGWHPRVSIEAGLKETIDWFISNGCQWSWEHSSSDVRSELSPDLKFALNTR